MAGLQQNSVVFNWKLLNGLGLNILLKYLVYVGAFLQIFFDTELLSEAVVEAVLNCVLRIFLFQLLTETLHLFS